MLNCLTSSFGWYNFACQLKKVLGKQRPYIHAQYMHKDLQYTTNIRVRADSLKRLELLFRYSIVKFNFTRDGFFLRSLHVLLQRQLHSRGGCTSTSCSRVRQKMFFHFSAGNLIVKCIFPQESDSVSFSMGFMYFLNLSLFNLGVLLLLRVQAWDKLDWPRVSYQPGYSGFPADAWFDQPLLPCLGHSMNHCVWFKCNLWWGPDTVPQGPGVDPRQSLSREWLTPC